MAIVKRADGYWVELRRQQYGRPVGPVMAWGGYPSRADAVLVERRNREALAQPPPARKPRAKPHRLPGLE
jgi:hypothetical protein